MLNKFTKYFAYVITYVGLALIAILNTITIKPALNQLLDFGSFIAAGKTAMEGKNPYAADSPLVFQVESQTTDRSLPSPNLNPPVSILFFMLFAGANSLRAVSAWRITTVILYGLGIFALTKAYPKFTTPTRILWALDLAGFWNTIALGQIYTPILILAIGEWIFTEKGYSKLGGIMLGAIIAIKPNFILWLFLLGIAGYTTVIISAVLTVLALSILPIPFFGPQIYQQWFTALSNYPSIGLLIAGNSSLQSLTARFGSAIPGIAMSVFLIGVSSYLVYRNKDSLNKINTLGVVSSLLISPFSWAGYTILTLPILFSKSRWNWGYKLSAVILSFPYILILYFFQKSLFNSALFGWLYGWGLLLILVGLIINRDGEKSSNSTHNQT